MNGIFRGVEGGIGGSTAAVGNGGSSTHSIPPFTYVPFSNRIKVIYTSDHHTGFVCSLLQLFTRCIMDHLHWIGCTICRAHDRYPIRACLLGLILYFLLSFRVMERH